MADIGNINEVAVADIGDINDVLAANIEYVNDQNFTVDYITLSQYTITIAGGLTDSVTVSSSGAWTSNKTSDPDSIINSYTLNGGDGDDLDITMNFKMPGSYADATIRVTCGSEFKDLVVSIDAGA